MNTSISSLISNLPLGRSLGGAVARRWPALAVATVAAAMPLGVALASTFDQTFGPSNFLSGISINPTHSYFCPDDPPDSHYCPAVTASTYSYHSPGVHAFSQKGNGVEAVADQTAGSWSAGVEALGDEGVVARGTTIGVDATANGTAVAGISANDVGGYFGGKEAPIRLAAATTAGAPTSGAHHKGELYVDSNGLLFYCTADGTPGTWHQLAFKN